MGAANSTPQTAHILNPVRTIPAIHVTPNVINRLESASQQLAETAIPNPVMEPKQHCPNCCRCGFFSKTEADLLQTKSNELQEKQFHKTLQKLEALLGKPVNWSDRSSKDLKMLQKRLIKCHSDNPREPLRCSEAAKDYHDFVFRHQFSAILMAKDIQPEF